MPGLFVGTTRAKNLYVRSAGAWALARNVWIRSAGAWVQVFFGPTVTGTRTVFDLTPLPNYRWTIDGTVANGAQSVLIEYNVNGGGFTTLATVDTTTTFTRTQNTTNTQSLTFRLTPYSGTGGSGTAGQTVIV